MPGAKVYSYPQLVRHLRTKLGDPEFEADLGTLVSEMPADYNQAEALEVVRRRIGSRLRNVPADVLTAEA